MKKDLLHTPEGVRDIYSTECAEKKVIENRLHDVCASYGYNDIQTPSIEFFDVFNKERGSVPSNEMFKLFDRYGNTLVLRPDMTPSIARATAKYFEDRVLPVKLCYLGNTFINVSKYYQGRLKENTMLGAELINDNSLAADYEIISMVIDCMLSAGLTEFQVELGNVAFFNGLLHKAGITGDSAEELLRLIKDKNYFGVEELLDSLNIDDAVAKALARCYHWTIAPCGNTALNLLGLSTQVTAVWSYISDGPYKTYEWNSTKLEFKHRTNKEITGLSHMTSLVIQALKTLGKKNVTPEVIQTLSTKLSLSEKQTCLKEATESTDWVYDTIRQICGGNTL